MEDYQKLNEMYRVSEKEELAKFKQLGKTPKEFYEQKRLKEELESQKMQEREM